MIRIPVLLLTLPFLIAAPPANAQPERLAYEGVLRDSAGDPITADLDMVFRLYPTEAATQAPFIEEHTASGTGAVSVEDGVFRVILGTGANVGTTTLSGFFETHEDAWLEMVVDGDLLEPRIPLSSAGFALRSETLDGSKLADVLARPNHTGQMPPDAIDPQGPGSGLDADRLDSREVGSEAGRIPVNDGSLNQTLNADLLDGLEASELMASSGGGGTCGLVSYWFSSIDGPTPKSCLTTPETFTCPNGTQLLAACARESWLPGGTQGVSGETAIGSATNLTCHPLRKDEVTWTTSSIETTCPCTAGSDPQNDCTSIYTVMILQCCTN